MVLPVDISSSEGVYSQPNALHDIKTAFVMAGSGRFGSNAKRIADLFDFKQAPAPLETSGFRICLQAPFSPRLSDVVPMPYM